MKNLWLLCFLIVTHFLGATSSFLFKTFTTKDGLPSAMVKVAFEDSRGFLWIGSDAGISRFDGAEFKNYSIIDGLAYNFVTAFAEDTSGLLWVGTGNGLSRFDGQQFTNFYKKDGLASNDIKCLAADSEGNLWIGTSGGLSRWNGKEFTNYLTGADLTVYSLDVHSEYGLLVGTSHGFYRIYDNDLEMIWRPESRKIIMDMTIAGDSVWLCSLFKDIYIWDGDGLKEVNYDHSQHFIAGSMEKDHQGNIIVSHQRELTYFTTKGQTNKIKGFLQSPYNSINSIYIDRDNNLWVLTINGLVRAKRSYVARYGCVGEGCINNYPSLLVGSDGRIIAGSNGGRIFAVEGERTVRVFKDKPRQQGEINAMVEDNMGRLWMATYLGGIVVFDGERYQHLNSENKLPNNKVWALMVDNEGAVWAGMTDYLLEISDQGIQKYRREGLNFASIVKSENGLTFLATNKGIYYFSGGRFKRVSDSTMSVTVNKLLCKDDKLIAGTKGLGVIVYEISDAGKLETIRSFNTTNGLESNFITNMIFDQDDNLWLGTKNGIYRIKGDLTKRDPLISGFDEAHGIADNAWGVVSMVNDAHGNIWIGTSNGLYEVRLGQYQADTVPPTMHLVGIKVDQQPVTKLSKSQSAARFTSFPQELELPYHQNDFTFHFTGIDLTNPQNVRYRYKLEGFDKKWSPATEKRVAQYTNLPPGNYSFLLKARNGDGIWANQPEAYHFSILPPFWATWWFRFLVIATIGGGIYLVYRYRVNAVIRQQREKIRLNEQLMESRLKAFQAQLNPHFIFNSLSSIQHFITNDDKQSALTYLPKFARLLRQVLQNSMETYITLDEELKMIRSYIEMEQLRFDNQFQYTLQVDEEVHVDQVEIPGLLLQPYIENAIVHGLLHKKGQGLLEISVGKEGNSLICVIRDNGIGRTKSKEMKAKRSVNYKSYGMKIARERLGLLNRDEPNHGKVNVEDLADEAGNPTGTKVTIYISLN